MGIFSKIKKEDELVLVFHVGSSAVGAAFFLTQSSGIPKIMFSIREPILVQEEINIEKFEISMFKSLENVVDKAYGAKLGAPSKIFCILSSPWHTSQTRIISLKKNIPFVFTSKLADDLIEKEIKLFEEENLAKYKSISDSVRSIEIKNIKTSLNGYETSKPINQKVKELEMVVFVSFGGEQVLKKIENTIRKNFHFDSIKFSSFVMATFTAVRDMYPGQENFLLVDISGEMTDISMVKKNILRESISFPLGRNFLIRGVASGLSCSLDEASSMISLLKDGHEEAGTNEKILKIMNNLRVEWLKNFQDSLANISKDISIPATIYIAINKDLADFFSETIKTEQFTQYTLTESKFEVFFLNTSVLHGIATFEDAVIREPFLIIDASYINRFLI